MEIDWSKAPEGATHHNYDCYCPWLRDGKLPAYFHRGEWVEYANPDIGRAHINKACSVPRPAGAPAAPTWTGAGLPPAGTACEVRNNVTGGWDAVDEVLAHTEIQGTAVAVFKRADRVFYSRAMDFRPLSTPEQIAAEEREKAVEQMVKCIAGDTTGVGMADAMICAKALYDAGYRKQA